MSDETFDTINNLGSHTMVGGGDMEFFFHCLDENGAPINITGATTSIKFCPIGQTDVVSISKNGIITDAVNGTFKTVLIVGNTSMLYGVYTFQPTIVSAPPDSTTYRPGQGILNIVSLIQ